VSRLLNTAIALLVLAGCAPTRQTVYQDPRATLAFRCVAVAPFENLSMTPGAGLAFSDALAGVLYGARRFDVVERHEIQRHLNLVASSARPDAPIQPAAFRSSTQQAPTSTSPMNAAAGVTMDPQSAIRVGRAVQADAVIVGSVTDYGYRSPDGRPVIGVSMRIVDVREGKVVYVAEGSYTPHPLRKGPALLTSSADFVAAQLIAPLNLLGEGFAAPGSCGLPSPAMTVSTAAPAPEIAPEALGLPLGPDTPITMPPQTDEGEVEGEPEGEIEGPVITNPAVLALLKRLGESDRLILDDVQFQLDKIEFADGNPPEVLHTLGLTLQENPALRIGIDSHTDASGDADFKRQLTQDRANLIRDFLVETFGINPSRIEASGRAGDMPIRPNINRKNRETNRRIEITVQQGS
jgi:outer membrane protein OmpA-like peptidoglycan-associated protein